MFGPFRLFVAGAVVLGVLAVGAFVLVPFLLEVVVARDLQDRLGLSSTPEVEVRGNPVGMLTGGVGGGRVVLPGYDLGGINTKRVEIELSPFDVNVLGSLTGGRLAFEKPISGALRAVLSEAEVGRIAASEVTGFPVRDLQLEEGQATAQTEAYAFGQSLPVAVEGNASAQDNALTFEPSNVEAAGVTVPQGLAGELLEAIGFVYPIEGLPPEVEITGARIAPDRLVLTGDVTGLP